MEIEKLYDAQIEYLQSSGTQWINTQYNPTTNTKAEMRCNINSAAQYDTPFGSRLSSTSQTFLVFARYGSSNTAYYAFAGPDTQIGSNAANYNNDITITLDSSSVVFGNSSASVPSGRTLSSTYPIYLFNLNQNNSAYSASVCGCSMKLYSFKLYESNTLVRDFIPVRVGQVGYLYDKVSRQLFGNSGTDSFTLGPDK